MDAASVMHGDSWSLAFHSFIKIKVKFDKKNPQFYNALLFNITASVKSITIQIKKIYNMFCC